MRQHYRLALCAGVGLLALGATGCLPSISDLDSGPLTSTFAVSDYYTPSGFMGDGQYFGSLVGTTNQNCKPRPQGARGNCYSFTYYPNTIDKDPWAGVFWVFPANSWGSTYGHAIDASKFTRISFYAAVEGPTPWTVGGSTQKFNGIAGGIDPKGFFSDPKRPNRSPDYIDGVYANVGVDINAGMNGVGPELKQFHIALTDFNKNFGCVVPPPPPEPGQPAPIPSPENCVEIQDPSQPNDPNAKIKVASDLIGAFAWSLHYPTDQTQCRPPSDPSLPADWCHTDQHSSQFVNPAPVKIYLDDIVWESQ